MKGMKMGEKVIAQRWQIWRSRFQRLYQRARNYRLSKGEKTGVALLVANVPVGYGGMLICDLLAIKTQKFAYVYLGFGFYGLSWLIFGVGLLLAGKTGLKLSRQILKKAWRTLIHRKAPESERNGQDQQPH